MELVRHFGFEVIGVQLLDQGSQAPIGAGEFDRRLQDEDSRPSLANRADRCAHLGPRLEAPPIGAGVNAEVDERVDLARDLDGRIVRHVIGPLRIGLSAIRDGLGADVESDE